MPIIVLVVVVILTFGFPMFQRMQKKIDNVNKTEAGTSIREVTRVDIPSISVSFDCDAEMLRDMRKYKSKPSVLVEYYDPSKSGDLSEDEMYVKGYSEQMLADTDDGGIWRVKFSLEDLGNV